MIIWADGTVVRTGDRWAGAVEVMIDTGAGSPTRSLAYTGLVGEPAVGDRALINVAALQRGLGTGGYALVVALLDAAGRPARQPAPPSGHLVKARYTPLQAMISGVDEQGSRFHDQLVDADDLAGQVVIVADLHSALAPVLAGLRAALPDRPPRVAYLMTDDAALPIAFSRTVAGLQEAGWIAVTITAGQAYGGDLEAVTVHSGLLAARTAVAADVVVVTQGPGNLGTGTRWGFSGARAGEVINATAGLDGRAVAALRISGADPRPRHRGVSHHSLTAYGRVALRPADIAVPDLSGTDLDEVVAEQVLELGGLHRLHRVPVDGLDAALAGCPVPLSSMGRGPGQDPAYFLAAAAAGRLAAGLLPDAP